MLAKYCTGCRLESLPPLTHDRAHLASGVRPRSPQLAARTHASGGLSACKGFRIHLATRLGRRRPLEPHRQGGGLRRQRLGPQQAAASSAAALAEGWPLWTALSLCAAASQVIERRTPLGAVLSAPLVAMLLALAGAATGLLPTASPTYDTVWRFLMPLAAAMYLLEGDLSKLFSSAGPTLAGFLLGALGTVAGTGLAFALVGSRLGPEGWKVAAALCASYIGGSVNFAAVAQALTLAPGPALAGAMAADNCAMAAYICCIMSIPARDAAAAAGGEQQAHAGSSPGSSGSSSSTSAAISGSSKAAAQVTAESLALSLAAAALACSAGGRLAEAAGFPSGGLAAMALLASGIAVLGSGAASPWGRRTPSSSSGGAGSSNSSVRSSSSSSNGGSESGGGSAGSSAGSPFAGAGSSAGSPFAGAEALGGALMMTFFATIGAAAGSLEALRGAGWLLLFILVQLGTHLVVCLGLGTALRLPMQALLIASNANVGGPATAAAMASAKRWPHMVQPAMLCGSLGYAVATGIGLGMGSWLRSWAA